MGLIIKRSMKAFWNTGPRSRPPALLWSISYWRQVTLLMLLSILYFPEKAEDSRKLKKVHELFRYQYFSEQCRHYVPKQNTAYKHWLKSFSSINYEAKKREGRNKNCSLCKSGTNLYIMWFGLTWGLEQCWQKCHSLYIIRTCIYGWVYKCFRYFYQWY